MQGKIQTLEFTNRKYHNEKIFDDAKCSTCDCKSVHVETSPRNSVVPDCLKRHALEHNCDNEARGVADHPAHGDFKYEPKAITGKDAEVEEEDGEFGKVLNEGIIYASSVVKLSTVSFTVANA
jgi:hypothetical protein